MNAEILPAVPRALAQIEGDRYQAAMLTWLEGKAARTRRSYMTTLRAFLGAAEKHPAEIEPLDVASWKEGLKRRGLTDGTVAHWNRPGMIRSSRRPPTRADI